MSRRLDTPDGRYTHDQVMAVITAAVAHKPKVRIDVWDRVRGGQKEWDLQLQSVTVEFDGDRRVPGSLTMVTEPFPELLRSPFRYMFVPWVGFGPMPDSGTAWLQYGAYLSTTPRRVVQRIGESSNRELWTMVCGDLLHAATLTGPGQQTFSANQGTRITSAFQQAAFRAGEIDFSQIRTDDDVLAETLAWSVKTGPVGIRQLSQTEYAQALRAYTAAVGYLHYWRKIDAYAQKYGKPPMNIASDPPRPTRVVQRDQENRALHWTDVYDVLTDLLGYASPHRDMSGRLVAKPAADLSTTAPTISYGTDSRGIIVGQPEIEPDMADLTNHVFVRATESTLINPGVVVGEADLSRLLPLHPMAAVNCGLEMQDEIEPQSSMSQGAATALAQRELYSRLVGYETISIETALNPQHEGYEPVTLHLENDSEFGTPQVTSELSWRADLLRGRMAHRLGRAYRPAT